MGFFSPHRRGRGLSSRTNRSYHGGSLPQGWYFDENDVLRDGAGRRVKTYSLAECIRDLERRMRCAYCAMPRKNLKTDERCGSCGAKPPVTISGM